MNLKVTVTFTGALLALALSLISAQEPVCYSGYIMDKYCIDQGNMIDNGLPTLKQPEEHSVHCLVEISNCVDSGYEVLVDVNADEYERAVELDATGNAKVIQVAREVGSCGTCFSPDGPGKGFSATVVGFLDASYSGTPPRLLVSELYYNVSCESALVRVSTGTSTNTSAPSAVPVTSSPAPVSPSPQAAPVSPPSAEGTTPPVSNPPTSMPFTSTPQANATPTLTPTAGSTTKMSGAIQQDYFLVIGLSILVFLMN